MMSQRISLAFHIVLTLFHVIFMHSSWSSSYSLLAFTFLFMAKHNYLCEWMVIKVYRKVMIFNKFFMVKYNEKAVTRLCIS